MRWIHCRGESAPGRFRAGGSPPGHPASIPWCNPNINKPKWFYFKKMKQNPTWCAGIAFCLFFFLCPRAAALLQNPLGAAESARSGAAPCPPPKPPGRGGQKAQIAAPAAHCPSPAVLGRIVPVSANPNPPEGSMWSSRCRPAAGAAAVPPPEGFWGRKGDFG